jgi:hypothetical protein
LVICVYFFWFGFLRGQRTILDMPPALQTSSRSQYAPENCGTYNIPIRIDLATQGFAAASTLQFFWLDGVSPGGDGTTTIAKVAGDKLEVVQTLATERGARTMALDPVSHRIYLATAEFDERAKDEHGRPEIVDGTFHVLVIGQ